MKVRSSTIGKYRTHTAVCSIAAAVYVFTAASKRHCSVKLQQLVMQAAFEYACITYASAIISLGSTLLVLYSLFYTC
jgi:hypothetical protein